MMIKILLVVILCVALVAPAIGIASIGGDCCSECNCAYWSCLATCLIGIAIDQLLDWFWKSVDP